MAMTKEYIQEMMDKPAISCCRIEAGKILEATNLEDPEIFPDLEDSNLLVITEDCLKIRDVLGCKLIKTIDSLTPITAEVLEKIVKNYNEDAFAVLKINKKANEIIQIKDLEAEKNLEKLEESLLVNLDGTLKIKEVIGKTLTVDTIALTPLKREHFENKENGENSNFNEGNNSIVNNYGILKIKIGEGKNIDIEIPMMNQGMMINSSVKSENVSKTKTFENLESKKIRTLVRKHFKIEKVTLAEETKIKGTTLYLRKEAVEEASKKNPLVVGMKIEIITPETYKTYSETIMDVQPIATKEGEDKIGNGVTRVLDGVVMMVTGTDENGVQIGEFGSSEGILEDNIMWGRPGSPDRGDIIIKTQVTIKAGTNMERPGPLAAHTVSDIITQEIRKALKEADEKLIVSEEVLNQFRRPGKKKVVVIKEIMGQGAMHDNLILPVEPVGVLGGKPNVDLGNIPVMLSPLEVLDGGIHALTCIGPASKECSRHYFREPLVIEAMNDEEIDLCGVIFVGSPQINSEKFYVSERLGMIVEALDVEGAIVTTEGFGNNHIDFASHIEQVGMRGIEVVGMSFAGVQGALVVGNKYMKNMVDNNKSVDGIENEILACNTLCQEDAIRALSMLKTSMLGEKVLESERKWNPNIKESNIEDIEKTLGIKITRSPKH